MKSNPKQKAVYLALCILAARCLLGSLFAGNASALLFSLLGGTLAMLVMLALSRLPEERWADIEAFARQITAEKNEADQD